MDTKSTGTPVHPPEEILIFQSGAGGINICRTALRRQLGLKSPDDFLTFAGLERIQESTYENKPQLLITSSDGGEIGPILDMAKRLRRKNPLLVIVLLDTVIKNWSAPPEFDYAICSGHDEHWEEKLADTVSHFRYGTLRRKLPRV